MGLLFALFNAVVSISDYIALNESIIVELKMTAKFLIDVICQSSLYIRAAEPTAQEPKMTGGNIFLARGIH
jgi:hypothetical protein